MPLVFSIIFLTHISIESADSHPKYASQLFFNYYNDTKRPEDILKIPLRFNWKSSPLITLNLLKPTPIIKFCRADWFFLSHDKGPSPRLSTPYSSFSYFYGPTKGLSWPLWVQVEISQRIFSISLISVQNGDVRFWRGRFHGNLSSGREVNEPMSLSDSLLQDLRQYR